MSNFWSECVVRMASIKTIGTFAVIIGCFAIIYPRFMHPMVLRMFGMHTVPQKEEDSMFPPHLRGNGPLPKDRRPPPMPGDPRADIRQHMRPGAHPGMRAAAEMQKQQSPGGTGKGMMGIVLPMYAVGICVYLVYTLFKVFNKRGQYSDPYSTKSRYEGDGGNPQLDRMGFPRGMQEQTDVQCYLQQRHQEKELEDLLSKLDDTRNVSEDEMRALQKRLEDTEAQMTRILAAMQAMQSRVTTAGSETAAEDVETVGRAADGSGAASSSEKKPASASADVSPDTESFEIVKNGESPSPEPNSSSEASSPSLIQPSDEGKDSGEEPNEEAEETEEQEEMIDTKPEESEDSTVRHRKGGNVNED